MRLSRNWIKKIMQGETGKGSANLPDELIKLTLALSVYIPQQSYQTLSPSKRKDSATCPAFLRKAFVECLTENQAFRLKELYLICARYNISVPSELLPECMGLYEPEDPMALRTLKVLKDELQFLGQNFPTYLPFRELDEMEWSSLKPKERKIHLQTRLAWSCPKQAFQWIESLSATERADLLGSFIYYDWDGRKAFAEQMAGSQSKKANAWTNAYLLKYMDTSLTGIAIEYLQELSTEDSNFITLDSGTDTPFPIAPPHVLKDIDNEQLYLLAWINPALLFSNSTLSPREFSERLLQKKDAPQYVLALLHASVYHAEQDWISYVLELVSYGDLFEIWDDDTPSPLLQNIPGELILEAFHRDQEKAETDMDRLDAVYHWLFAADLFLSKEVTEKVWPAIVNGVDLLSVGGISSKKYTPFFDWVQFRIYPGFPIHWSIQKSKSGLIHEFQQSVNKRYHFYKSLNAWLKNNQSN